MDKKEYFSNHKYIEVPECWFQLLHIEFEVNGEKVRLGLEHILLLAKILSLSYNNDDSQNYRKYCWAPDDYFAGCFNTPSATIQKWMKRLSDCKLITRDTKMFDDLIKHRTIQINMKKISKLCKERDGKEYALIERKRRMALTQNDAAMDEMNNLTDETELPKDDDTIDDWNELLDFYTDLQNEDVKNDGSESSNLNSDTSGDDVIIDDEDLFT